MSIVLDILTCTAVALFLAWVLNASPYPPFTGWWRVLLVAWTNVVYLGIKMLT